MGDIYVLNLDFHNFQKYLAGYIDFYNVIDF